MTQPFQPFFSDTQITRLVGSMTTTSAAFDPKSKYVCKVVGFLYNGSAYKARLPLSYWTSIEYFGSVLAEAGNPQVTDTYNGSPSWTVTPSGKGTELQMERVNVANGTDIYDAACFQIALGLANEKKISSKSDPLTMLIDNQTESIVQGIDGNKTNPPQDDDANRGSTVETGKNPYFYYGGYPKANPTASEVGPAGTALTGSSAYYFRMVGQAWLTQDPFFLTESGEKYQQYIKPATDAPPQYPEGVVTWADWKPITGENVWGLIMGPIRTWFMTNKPGTLSSGSQEYKIATGILGALQAMQGKTGGIYYAPQGTDGNTGEIVSPFTISTENNASALAALRILALALSESDPNQSTIKTLIGDKQTGILGYFYKYAWNGTIFDQGGIEVFNQDGTFKSFNRTSEPKAVDVNTWGVAALTPQVVDSWFGAGTAYKIWENIKSWGAFQYNGTLMGVGYDDKNDGGTVMSAEWTFGAINMVRMMMTYYGTTSAYYQQLQSDEKAMVTGVQQLYSDNYPKAPAFQSDIPSGYTSYMPVSSGDSNSWFVYSNKRYYIPFGWYGNPLPSLCSTAWAVMVNYGYNPFSLDAEGTYGPWEDG